MKKDYSFKTDTQKGKLFLLLLLLFSVVLSAQIKDTSVLDGVTIISSRNTFLTPGSKTEEIDSLTLLYFNQNTLAQLLQQQSQVYIKTYGAGSLATSSFRGAGASQTVLLWNGFNLNTPNYGQFDLALIPVSFINKAEINYGGSSALWGSGAIGGTLQLSSEGHFNEGFKVNAGTAFSSFGNFMQNGGAALSRKNLVVSLKFFRVDNENIFPFHDPSIPGNPLEKMTNAHVKQLGILNENYFRINSFQKINFRIWTQWNDREIPPSLFEKSTHSNQKDVSYRYTSEWQRSKNNNVVMARAAVFDERLLYTEKDFNYAAYNSSVTFISELEDNFYISKHKSLNGGINNTFVRAKADNYNGKITQNTTAIFASYRYAAEKINAVLSAREELNSGKIIPFVFSGSLNYALRSWVNIKIAAAKVYRNPTLNDKFWNPGGNPDLKPETGYSEEGGIVLTGKKGKLFSMRFEGTLFNRNIKNWILWLPGQSYWQPGNLMEVWSRGTETKTTFQYQLATMKLKLDVMSSYVISTNEKTKTVDDASVGKQLIYVPIYTGGGNVSLLSKIFSFTFNETYTGYRFTSTDNTQYLDPYFLSNIYAAGTFSIKKYKINVTAGMYNIFNASYLVIAARPMPGRNYQVSFQFYFQP